MISGIHSIIFSKDADKARAFFRDVLSWSSVDAGDGWLIFALPPAELAVHPTDDDEHHQIYSCVTTSTGRWRNSRAKTSSSPARSTTKDGGCSPRSRFPVAARSEYTNRSTRQRSPGRTEGPSGDLNGVMHRGIHAQHRARMPGACVGGSIPPGGTHTFLRFCWSQRRCRGELAPNAGERPWGNISVLEVGRRSLSAPADRRRC
jgi:hypothetical protein